MPGWSAHGEQPTPRWSKGGHVMLHVLCSAKAHMLPRHTTLAPPATLPDLPSTIQCAMAGQSSNAGGSGVHRVLSPTSPGGSDVGSAASGLGSRSVPASNRLGHLPGAGLSSLQLALGGDGGGPGSVSGLSGFNAISTLLNNPKRPQRPIDPSSSRYPPISQSHTDLPKVKRADYEAFVSATQTEWERFQRNIKLGSTGQARLEAEQAVSEDDGGDREAMRLEQAEEDHTAAVVGKKKLPPLSTVPQVFFAEDFDLGNPYTFDLVTERYKVVGAASNTQKNGSALPVNGYDVALNQMLQEKLSYYSDVVEQHLILEISARSSPFFAALGNLQDLEAEASSCLHKVEHLKSELEEKEEGIAKTGLRVIREQAKRREMVERLEAVGVLQLLCEKRDLCQLLVQNGEWSEALDVMDLLRNVVEGSEKLQSSSTGDGSLPPHVDLDLASIGSVKAFVPLLEEMKIAIASQLEMELLEILSNDLIDQIGEPTKAVVPPPVIDSSIAAMEEHKSGGAETESLHSETPAPPGVEAQDVSGEPASGREAQLQERIAAHLHGLTRTQGIDGAVGAYREGALQSTRKTFRTFLCESSEMRTNERRDELANLLEDDEAASGKVDVVLGPGGVEAAGKLRDLDHNSFLDLARFLLMGLTRSIKAVEVQTRVLLRVLAEAGRSEAEDVTVGVMMPLGVSPSLPTSLTAVVSDVCALAHVLSSRLISLRSSTHVELTLKDFLTVFHLCWTFILQTETMCNRMIIGLRGVVLNQAKAWLANFHRIRIERAARAVEEETWGQAEVAEAQQERINLIVESATSDPPLLVVTVDEILAPLQAGQTQPGAGSASPGKASSKTLEIEERQFFVVGATLDVLEVLLEYLKVVINLPLLSTETMGRVVEFCKQFNSRTCQVVLGAGAMRSAGLKNITAKHLALASQSLSVMITLIPYIRETVRRHLSPRQAVMLIEFDKLKRDYQEHQYEIHSKLVAIMSDRLTVHCRALGDIVWNEESDGTDPIKPVADLAKETTTLHKVLCRYSQSSVVEQVIGQVLFAIDKRLATEFQKVEVTEEAAWRKMKIAKEFFDDKFGGLKYVQWTAKELDGVIEEHKAALEKKKTTAAAATVPENKEPVPAYKPRIPLFGRKNNQLPGTPPTNGRGSMESAEAKTEEEIPSLAMPVAASSGEVEPLTVTNEESAPSSTAVEAQAAPPPTPSKDVEAPTASPIIAQAENGTVDSASFATPRSPSPPATPERVSQESVASPTPGARMTLQQRLAEAARRRAQGNSSRPSTATGRPASETEGAKGMSIGDGQEELRQEVKEKPKEAAAEEEQTTVEMDGTEPRVEEGTNAGEMKSAEESNGAENSSALEGGQVQSLASTIGSDEVEGDDEGKGAVNATVEASGPTDDDRANAPLQTKQGQVNGIQGSGPVASTSEHHEHDGVQEGKPETEGHENAQTQPGAESNVGGGAGDDVQL